MEQSKPRQISAATIDPQTLEEALGVIKSLRERNRVIFIDMLKYKKHRNEARAEIIALEKRMPLRRLMRRLGWVKAAPKGIE
jgi:hypothetical protein